MARKSKYPIEDKLRAIERVKIEKESVSRVASEIGCHDSTLQEWINNYESMGLDGIMAREKNSVIKAETKRQAVLDYLEGKGSIAAICKQYQIRSTTTLRQWIRLYREKKELKSSGTGSSPNLNHGRKTTLQERICITKDCLEHGLSYSDAAKKYGVSYQQVYNWIKKYKVQGVDGLEDRRGRRK